MEKTKTKREKCKYSFPSIKLTVEKKKKKQEDGLVYNCLHEECRKEDISDNDCKNCDHYKSRYIEYPLTIQGLELKQIDTHNQRNVGRPCKIRVCEEKSSEKTYFGIYLGELPYFLNALFSEESGILTCSAASNPAIYVPELKKIVYGIESWWGFINGPEELKDITDADIDNQWYVKLLKEYTKDGGNKDA